MHSVLPTTSGRQGRRWPLGVLALAVVLGIGVPARAQTNSGPIQVSFIDDDTAKGAAGKTESTLSSPIVDPAVSPAGCSTCGGGLLGMPGDPYAPYGCGTPCWSCGNCY